MSCCATALSLGGASPLSVYISFGGQHTLRFRQGKHMSGRLIVDGSEIYFWTYHSVVPRTDSLLVVTKTTWSYAPGCDAIAKSIENHENDDFRENRHFAIGTPQIGKMTDFPVLDHDFRDPTPPGGVPPLGGVPRGGAPPWGGSPGGVPPPGGVPRGGSPPLGGVPGGVPPGGAPGRGVLYQRLSHSQRGVFWPLTTTKKVNRKL